MLMGTMDRISHQRVVPCRQMVIGNGAIVRAAAPSQSHWYHELLTDAQCAVHLACEVRSPGERYKMWCGSSQASSDGCRDGQQVYAHAHLQRVEDDGERSPMYIARSSDGNE